MYGYVYKTTNLINGKIYIGQKASEIFIESYKGSGIILIKALDKYGEENFKVEILEECNSKDELDLVEKKWIKILKATDDSIGYNIAEGGQGGNLGDKVNTRISTALRGKSKHKGWHPYNNGINIIHLYNGEPIPEGFVYGNLPKSEESIKKWKNTMNSKSSKELEEIRNKRNETRKKTLEKKSEEERALVGKHISEGRKGIEPWNKGKSWLTEEHKEKLRESASKPKSEEHRKHLSESRKLSGCSKGEKNPRAKKVLCLETGVVYGYSGEAAKDLNLSARQIRKCCNGGVETVGGFHWKFLNDSDKRDK